MNKEKQLIKEIQGIALDLMSDWPSTRNKQKKFVLEYISGGFINASEAARNVGYSKKTARSIASNMLAGVDKYKHIPPVLSQVKDEYDKRLSELKIADGTEILQYISSIMRGEQTEQTMIGIGEGAQEITDIDVSAKDRIKAAELLGKSYGMWTDKVDVTNRDIVIEVGDWDDDIESES